MMRKSMILGVLIVFLAAATGAFAEEVFVTAKGKKYHKAICRVVKNKEGITKLEKEAALEEGYDPCGRCFKEDILEDDTQSQVTDESKKEKLGS